MPVNPALLRQAKERRQSLENRIADQITRFAGSMKFVYLHVIWFASWISFTMGSAEQPGDQVDRAPHDHHAEQVRQ
jgi:uncharacterized membrane protein